MQPIQTFDQLKQTYRNPNQHWLYVIMANANDPSDATTTILNNLDMFDLDTGEDCDYFLPGFACDTHGLVPTEYLHYFENSSTASVFLGRLGCKVPFSGRDFVSFYRTLELESHHEWRYSGRCELLVFNIDPHTHHIDTQDFFSYDLDDIVNNKRRISEFIRGMIMISQDHCDKVTSKRRIDEIYYDLVMPRESCQNNEYLQKCVRAFERSGFSGTEYCFISYSSKDFRFVQRVRDLLIENGVKCWMAPFDIPRGTSYPYIIENAILNASMYVLMLSKNAVNSIWVEKELLRAISAFQQQSPNKICVAWCGGEFSLKGTAFALPLENIQIKTFLEGNPENWKRLKEEFQMNKSLPAPSIETSQNTDNGVVTENPYRYRDYYQINKARKRIKRLEETDTQFLCSFAHKLYNYLTEIEQETHLINEEIPDLDLTDDIKLFHNALHNLGESIRRFDEEINRYDRASVRMYRLFKSFEDDSFRYRRDLIREINHAMYMVDIYGRIFEDAKRKMRE